MARALRPGGLGVGVYAGEEQVGPQSTEVVAKPLYGAVGGDEEVQDVEALGTEVARQLGVGSGGCDYQVAGGRGVPQVVEQPWDTIGSGAGGQSQ
jgi:hypothetical protein